MKAINTKFGTIYIEDLEYDRHCPAMREEEDRIKIFDSNENYMDVYTMECIEDFARMENKTLEEVYQEMIRRYEQADNLDAICPDIRFRTNDIVKLVLFMQVDRYLDMDNGELVAKILNEPDSLEELIKGHEWVNKIGDTYLLIEEY